MSKNVFSFITKNLNWKVLTKNLVTFKRWDGVKDEKFWYYRGSLKNSIFRGVSEKPIYTKTWTVCRVKRGSVEKEWGGFWGGLDT